jgi:hypothetical protein
LRRTLKYASLLRISGALHLCIFDQPGKKNFFNNLIGAEEPRVKKKSGMLIAECGIISVSIFYIPNSEIRIIIEPLDPGILEPSLQSDFTDCSLLCSHFP